MSEAELRKECAALRARLEEAEATLRAIRAGEVDAVVMGGQVYTLQSAETPYRTLVEAMNEVALTLTPDGTIYYCNGRLAELLGVPHDNLIGSPLRSVVAPADLPAFDALFVKGQQCASRGELNLRHPNSPAVPVQLSISSLQKDSATDLSVVITDLARRKQAEVALQKLNESLEQRVAERTAHLQAANGELKKANAELAYINKAMVGRELRMIELKKEVDKLCRQNGQPVRYGYAGD